MVEYEGGKDSGRTVSHLPVLLDEVLAALAPVSGKFVVDGTFGAGGYSRALLAQGAAIIGIDRDPSVSPFVMALKADFPDRFQFIEGRFSGLDSLVREATGTPVDAVVLDIGVSSMQLDEAARGFSFMRDGPLDMRMSAGGPDAADLVNGLDEKNLADLLYAFGEERKSRRIAKAIVLARADGPIARTGELAGIIEKSIGRKPGDIHPATRSFQALRIAVNGELDELVAGLFAAERLLGPGGKLVVVSFHSLEDRIVKRFLQEKDPDTQRSRHLPRSEVPAPRWTALAKPGKARRAEIERNPRARSAVIRSAVRTDAPARPVDAAHLGVPAFSLGGAA